MIKYKKIKIYILFYTIIYHKYMNIKNRIYIKIKKKKDF